VNEPNKVEVQLRIAFPKAPQIPSDDCIELRTKLPHFYHDDLVRILPAVLLDAITTPVHDFLDCVVRFLCGRNLPLLNGETEYSQAQEELNDYAARLRGKEDPFIQFTPQQATAIAVWLKLAGTWDDAFLDAEELASAIAYSNGRR
jgi:hypothetical protein